MIVMAWGGPHHGETVHVQLFARHLEEEVTPELRFPVRYETPQLLDLCGTEDYSAEAHMNSFECVYPIIQRHVIGYPEVYGVVYSPIYWPGKQADMSEAL